MRREMVVRQRLPIREDAMRSAGANHGDFRGEPRAPRARRRRRSPACAAARARRARAARARARRADSGSGRQPRCRRPLVGQRGRERGQRRKRSLRSGSGRRRVRGCERSGAEAAVAASVGAVGMRNIGDGNRARQLYAGDIIGRCARRARRNPIAYVLLTLAPLFWSCNWIVGRGLAHDVPPMAMTFFRWFFAIVMLAPFALPHVARRMAARAAPLEDAARARRDRRRHAQRARVSRAATTRRR